MKKTLLHRGIFLSLGIIGLSFASQVSARHFVKSDNSRIVSINYVPTLDNSVFGTFNSSSSFVGTLRAPAFPLMTPILRDGGHDGGHRGPGGDPDDSSGGGDTLNGGDTSHHCGGGHGVPGDGDTTGGFLGGDTTGGGCHGHGSDSTDLGDTNIFNDSTFFGHHGDDGNDTIDCGHHHADTVVTDTNAHTLFGGNQQSIMVRSHGQQANVTVLFTNNLSMSVKISNIALASGRYFTIISGAPSSTNPVTVAAGKSISLKVSFNAADQNVHTDQLVVATNSVQVLNTISFKGQQVAAAASVANSLPAGVTITALPNPVTTSLKVDLKGVASASAVIYDMQGKQVLSTTLTSSEWIWAGTSTDGSVLPAGTYLVRISGSSTDNTAFVTTQKIILAR